MALVFPTQPIKQSVVAAVCVRRRRPVRSARRWRRWETPERSVSTKSATALPTSSDEGERWATTYDPGIHIVCAKWG